MLRKRVEGQLASIEWLHQFRRAYNLKDLPQLPGHRKIQPGDVIVAGMSARMNAPAHVAVALSTNRDTCTIVESSLMEGVRRRDILLRPQLGSMSVRAAISVDTILANCVTTKNGSTPIDLRDKLEV